MTRKVLHYYKGISQSNPQLSPKQKAQVENLVDEEKMDALSEKLNVKEGAKLKFYLNLLFLLLKFLVKIKDYRREMFMITRDLDAETREVSMEKFNFSSEARALFGLIKARGEGNFTLESNCNRQAIGGAFIPGQLKKVYNYILIASYSPKKEDHGTCFSKESTAKLWFQPEEPEF